MEYFFCLFKAAESGEHRALSPTDIGSATVWLNPLEIFACLFRPAKTKGRPGGKLPDKIGGLPLFGTVGGGFQMIETFFESIN